MWWFVVDCGRLWLVVVGFFDRRLVVVSFLLNMVGTGII